MKEIREFQMAPPFIVQVNREAKELCLTVTRGTIFMLIEIDTEMPTAKRTYTPVGLRQPIPDHVASYVGSISPEEGFMLHFYRDKEILDA